jgi:chromosomal replication initiation ATPase DnaA
MKKECALIEIYNYVNYKLDIDISDTSRKQEFVYGRALFYKLARENTKLSFQKIGLKTNKDHSTVIHSIEKVFPTAMMYEDYIREAYDGFKVDLGYQLKRLIKLKKEIECLENKILKEYLF